MGDTNDTSNKGTAGLSTMDFMSMPGPMRRLLRMMLKKPEATYSELCDMVDAMAESKRMTRDELDQTLEELISKGWMEREDGDDPLYKIKLGKREGSDESRSEERSEELDTRTRKREGPRMKDLWDAVDTTSETDYRKTMGEDEEEDVIEETPAHSEPATKEAPPQRKKTIFGDLFSMFGGKKDKE